MKIVKIMLSELWDVRTRERSSRIFGSFLAHRILSSSENGRWSLNESIILSSSDKVNTHDVLIMINCSTEICEVRVVEACLEPCMKGCSWARHARRAESSATIPCIDAGASFSRRMKSTRLPVSLPVTVRMPNTHPKMERGSMM